MPPLLLASTLALALSSLIAEATGQDRAVALRGKVVNVEGAPIEGARVDLLGKGRTDPCLRSVTTNVDGRYEIETTGQDVRLAFCADGYARVRLQVPDGATIADTASLPRGVTITGRLRRPDGGPVVGARVIAKDMAPRASMLWVMTQATSDEDGLFHLRQAPISQFELEVKAEGFCDVRMLEVDRMAPLDLTLERAVEFAGTVVDADGRPATCTVRARGEDGHEIAQRIEAGAFRLWGHPGVRYRVSAMGSAAQGQVFGEVLEGAHRDLELRFGATDSPATAEILRFTARDASSGEAIDAFGINLGPNSTFHPSALHLSGWIRHSTEAGTLEVALPTVRAHGAGIALFRADGFADTPMRLPDPAAATGEGPVVTSVVVGMQRERVVTGTVLASDGMPVADAWVWALPTDIDVEGYSGRGINRVQTDAEGRYRCGRLEARQYFLQVFADGLPVPHPHEISTTDGDANHDVQLDGARSVTLSWRNPPSTKGWFVQLSPRYPTTSDRPLYHGLLPVTRPADFDAPLRIKSVPMTAVDVAFTRLSVGRVPYRHRLRIGSADLTKRATAGFDLSELHTGRILGTVQLARELEVARIVVRGNRGQCALVDPDGTFVLELTSGAHELTFRDLVGHAVLGSAQVQVSGGKDTELEIDLDAGTVIVAIEPAAGMTRPLSRTLTHRPAGTQEFGMTSGVDLRGLRGPVRLLLPADSHEICLRRAKGLLDGGFSMETVCSEVVRVRAGETARLTLRDPPRADSELESDKRGR